MLAGYCMGGTLAVAAAARRPDLVRALALLAAPWDFHAGNQARAHAGGGMLPLLEPALAFNDTLPVDVLQVLFAMLDPWGVADKYRAFARLDPASERARLFVALEDWLNDGVPLAAPVARECLADGMAPTRRRAGNGGSPACRSILRRCACRPSLPRRDATASCRRNRPARWRN